MKPYPVSLDPAFLHPTILETAGEVGPAWRHWGSVTGRAPSALELEAHLEPRPGQGLATRLGQGEEALLAPLGAKGEHELPGAPKEGGGLRLGRDRLTGEVFPPDLMPGVEQHEVDVGVAGELGPFLLLGPVQAVVGQQSTGEVAAQRRLLELPSQVGLELKGEGGGLAGVDQRVDESALEPEAGDLGE